MDEVIPPLTPVEEYPLHGWDYNRSYACVEPGSMAFDWRCPACVSEAEKHDPQTLTWWKLNAGIDDEQVTLGWLVGRSRAPGRAAAPTSGRAARRAAWSATTPSRGRP